jgi:hypothetical protein
VKKKLVFPKGKQAAKRSFELKIGIARWSGADCFFISFTPETPHAKLIINAIRTLFGLSVLIGACVCLGKWLSDRFDFGRPWQVAVVSFHIVKPNRNARNISFARLVARHFS